MNVLPAEINNCEEYLKTKQKKKKSKKKKVLLRERKKPTARRVASRCYAVSVGGTHPRPDLGPGWEGTPILLTGRTPILLTWEDTSC